MDIRQCFSEGTFKWDLRKLANKRPRTECMCMSYREGKCPREQEPSGKDDEAESTLLRFNELRKARTSFGGFRCSSHKVMSLKYDHLKEHHSLHGMLHTCDSFSFLPGALSHHQCSRHCHSTYHPSSKLPFHCCK